MGPCGMRIAVSGRGYNPVTQVERWLSKERTLRARYARGAQEGQRPGRSGGGGAKPDEVGQVGRLGVRHAEAVAEIILKRDAELLTGLQQAKEAIAVIVNLIRARAAGDHACDHVGAQIPPDSQTKCDTGYVRNHDGNAIHAS
jgi:hypothetical protein